MIDRQTILAQMEGLNRQLRQHEDELKAIEGAMQICRHWLSLCDQQEAQQAAHAETNGEAAKESELSEI